MSRLLSALQNLQDQGLFPASGDLDSVDPPQTPSDTPSTSPDGPLDPAAMTPEPGQAAKMTDNGPPEPPSVADLLGGTPPVLDVGLIQGTSHTAAEESAYADPGSDCRTDPLPAERSATALLDALLEEKLGALGIASEMTCPADPSGPALDAGGTNLASHAVETDTIETDTVETDTVETDTIETDTFEPNFLAPRSAEQDMLTPQSGPPAPPLPAPPLPPSPDGSEPYPQPVSSPRASAPALTTGVEPSPLDALAREFDPTFPRNADPNETTPDTPPPMMASAGAGDPNETTQPAHENVLQPIDRGIDASVLQEFTEPSAVDQFDDQPPAPQEAPTPMVPNLSVPDFSANKNGNETGRPFAETAATPTTGLEEITLPPNDDPAAIGRPAAASTGVRRQAVDLSQIADLDDPARLPEYQSLAKNIWSECRERQVRSVLLIGVSDESQLAAISSSLALQLADSAQARVLLVDGDIRDRRLSIALNQTATPGLAAAFDTERSTLPPAVPTTKQGLEFLPAGQPKSSIRRQDVGLVSQLLEDLGGQYDIVLVDGGTLPALPTEMLADACDVTYLVIGLGKTEIDEARSMVQRVREAGGQVLGCIALDAART